MWPKFDKGSDKKPCEKRIPMEEEIAVVGLIVQPTRSKRCLEDGDEPMVKRVRNFV